MPGLTIATDVVGPSPAPAQAETTPPRHASSRPPSPSRPSVSPITPTPESAGFLGPHPTHTAPTTTQSTIPDFAADRPMLTHTTQTDQVGITPAPAQTIDFESNPDVLALKSAISILQLQRARATADVQSLSRARDAALANPEAFTADLASGRVQMGGDPLLSGMRGPSGGEPMEEDDESSSSSGSDFDDDESTWQEVTPESEPKTDNDRNTSTNGATAGTLAATGEGAAGRTNQHRRKQQKHTINTQTAAATAPAPWHKLPKPQTVVRCPPVNWAQYGVVGESLDKLHAEQVTAPTPGAPMVLGPGGAFEFKAGGEPSRRLVGAAAPYSPMRDKLEKKGRGGKR